MPITKRWTKEAELSLIQDYFIANPYSESFLHDLQETWRQDGVADQEFKAKLRRVQMISQGKPECFIKMPEFHELGMSLLSNPESRNRFHMEMSNIMEKKSNGIPIDKVPSKLPTGEWYEDGVLEDIMKIYFDVIDEYGKRRWELPYTDRLLKDSVLASRLPFKTLGANRKQLQGTLKQLIERIITHPKMFGISRNTLLDLQTHSIQITATPSEDSNASISFKVKPKPFKEIAQDYFRMNPYQTDQLTLFAKLNALWTNQGYPIELLQVMREMIIDALSGKSLEIIEMLSEIGEEVIASEGGKHYRVILMRHRSSMQQLKTKATVLSKSLPSRVSRDQALNLIEAKFQSMRTGKPIYGIVKDKFGIESFLGQSARDTRPQKQQLQNIVKTIFDKPHSFGVSFHDIEDAKENVYKKQNRGTATPSPFTTPRGSTTIEDVTHTPLFQYSSRSKNLQLRRDSHISDH